MSARKNNPLILLVDDDHSVRHLCRLVLERTGFLVIEADSAFKAQMVWRDNWQSIDLLVTDLVMPQLGGKELAETLRAAQPSLPVLFVSGYSAEIISRHGVLARDAQFLNKPYTPGVLARKIREILDQSTNPQAPIRVPLTNARPR